MDGNWPLNNAGSLQSLIRATLVHSFEALGGDDEGDALADLGDEDGALLEIGLAADLAARVVLRRAGAVAIPSSDEGPFSGYCARLCHQATLALETIV